MDQHGDQPTGGDAPGADVTAGGAPRESDRPPVGEPLVVSRRNPEARPAKVPVPSSGTSENGLPESGLPVEPAVAPAEAEPPALDGEVVLVTAAAGELGGAISRELVQRGARVLLVDSDLEALVGVVDDLPAGRAVPLQCDIGSERELSAVVDFVVRATPVDAIVHVKGPPPAPPDLGRSFRSLVLGPIDLVAGLGEHLAPAAPVVLVADGPAEPDDDLARIAPGLVRDSVGGRRRVCSADRGAHVAPQRFADVLVDLLVHDDLVVERLVLAGTEVDAGSADAVAADATD